MFENTSPTKNKYKPPKTIPPNSFLFFEKQSDPVTFPRNLPEAPQQKRKYCTKHTGNWSAKVEQRGYGQALRQERIRDIENQLNQAYGQLRTA